MSNKLFNELFATLDCLQETLNSNRLHICYCLGSTDANKSSLINSICEKEVCKVSNDQMADGEIFQILPVAEVNASFVDIIGFGSQKDDSSLVEKLKEQMQTVLFPDAVIVVITREELINTKSLKNTMDDVNNVLNWMKKECYNTEIPVICVLNKIDEYFNNELPNSDADVKKVEEYTRKTLELVNKYLVIPTAKCIPVSVTKNYGINQLRLSINAVSPLNAQIIDKNLDYISQYRRSIANQIIAAFSTASAAVSFLPIADIIIVTFFQEWMCRMLACFSVDPSRTPDSFKTVNRIHQGTSLAIRTGALFVGSVFQLTLVGYLLDSGICVFAGAMSTAAVGWACYFYFVD
ncbi:unnamed protein product [Rotaria sordida]|uniref:G domain-containing protein n=1 Tax=Rotaria sordida TaxID=392033 RepID=A0A819V9R5_9BILA|nr:unnamed protein product [Rotaria sordida]CAF4105799.1 unnamed protein product [Rotaria sordida]